MSRIPLFLAVILITITTVSSSSISISTTNSDLPTTFQRPSFQSQALSHIEHVEWYHLDHQDRHLYNTESVHTGTGLKSHISYPFASRRTRIYNGLTLHFPEHVHLSVRALGQTYYLSLHLVSELKAENSSVITSTGTFPASLTTYRSYRRTPRDTWAVVTFRPDGTFQGLLIVDNEIIGIDHIEQHQQEMESNHYHSMAKSSQHGMIAYKYSSFKDTHVHGCGVIHAETQQVATEPLTPNQMRRHLLQNVINDPGNGICNGEPCRWLDDGSGAPCWPGITATNIKSMTFIPMGDYGFYQIYNSIPNCQSAIDQTMAIINAIFVPQFGIFNKVIETVIMDAGGQYAWNKAPSQKGGKCSNDGYSINQMLTDLTSYNRQDTNGEGIVKASERHIFTNCYPPAGTVGLAWVGTINSRGPNGCGVSSYSSSHWLTIAHEVGHNLGAPHTFGPDGRDPDGSVTGAVGGIMDYTQTGKFPRPESGLPGIAQFHPVITRPKICNQLKAAMTNDRSYVLKYIQPWTPTCNNGILEPGEDCDDTSGCCDLTTCRLVAGAQCTPGKGNSNPCCDSNTCLYKATQYGCPGGNSYCLMGQCANDGCTRYSNTAQCPNRDVKSPDYPGVATTDGCNFGCTYSTVSACTYPPRASPGNFGTIPDGAVCNDGTGKFTGTTGGKYGVCQGAKCIATTAPKPAVKYGDVGFVTSAPTKEAPTAAPTQSPNPEPTTPRPTTPAVTSAPTSGDVYSWIITSAFSACFDGSGVRTAKCNIAGTQVRSVACRNSAGVQVADMYCQNIAKPATSQACRGECNYEWYADPNGWSQCNYDCTSPGISPTQTRAIFCYEQGDTTRSNPLNTDPVSGPCAQTVKPTSVQGCSTQACPVKLNVPPFDAVCSKDCGGGVQTRTVSCIYTQNNRQFNVPLTSTDSRWAPFISACRTELNKDPKPVTSQPCNTQACAQYNWRSSNFGSCSATCKTATGATPTRTRTVTCVESNNGVDTVVADDKCVASLKPVTSEPCNTQACAVYAWVLGDWSTCTAKCGGGLQTRSVVCKDNNGNAASDNTCTEQVKPISQQTCNTQLCDNFAWRTTEYGVCTVTCGGGTQTRTVSCYNTIVEAPQPTVPDNNCATAGPKPVSQQACSQQACPKYEWLAGDYGNCDKICGVGTRTRSVKCIQIGPNDIVSDSLCTGTKPSTSGACNTAPCQQSNWRTGEWGACSQTCGTGGVRTRVVDCVDQSFNPAQGCDTAIKPVSQELCNTQTCPTQWLAGPFGDCSKPCGVGTYTRSVTCVYRDTQKSTGDDSLCTSTQPTSSAVCNTFACPTYRAGAWGPCQSPLGCGDGIQTRPLTCFDSFGVQVDMKLCAQATAPFTQQTCSLDPCPHWHRDPWNDCSQPCGGGTQTRSLTCRMPHDAIWQGQKALNDSLCPDINISGADGDAADSKSGLATIQACNTDPCASYYWNTTYGECSKQCGGGVQLATSTCYSNTGSIANPALCANKKPDPQRPCNTYLCPNYIWKAKEWSQCSVYCGTGTQTREVYCANISPNSAVLQETVADSYCESQGLPKLASQQNCVNPSDKCSGARPNQVDGICITDRTNPLYGKCRCRYGFAGADCREAPSISDVTTDAGRVGVGVGVPVGDSLSISWRSTGDIDSVSIVLGQRGSRNPVSRYIIVNKPLRNTASWRVGIGADGISLMKNLSPGSGYFITVFASNTIQGSSAEFSIGDACSVKSCGFGTCRDGQCQCNDAYTIDGDGKCSIPRCTTSNCNVNGGKCSATKQPSGSFCECAAGWQGINCGTPKTCTATCGQGGDFAPFAIDDPVNPSCPTAFQCQCLPNYVSDGSTCRCDPGCGPYGVAASDCSGCTCLPGWFGQKCDRIYWTLRTQFIIPSGTAFLQDTILKQHFGRTTSIDLATASGFPIERIILDDISIPGPTTATVSFRLLSVATFGAAIGEVQQLVTSRGQRSGLFNPATPTAEHHALAARRAAHALQSDGLTPSQVTQIAELKQAYAILAAVLGDASSYAWNGVGTSYMDKSYAITLSDASGKSGTLPPPPPKPLEPFTRSTPPGGPGDVGTSSSNSSSSNNMIIIIAAAVAGGIVALIVLAIIIYFCKRRSSSSTSWTKDSQKMELRTFDSFNANANGTNNNNNNNAAWTSSVSAAAVPASSGVASWAKGMSSPSTPAVLPTSYAAASAASPTSYAASNVGYNASTGYSQEGYAANTTGTLEANPLTLPPGWSQQFTNDGTPYYFNSLTSQTQWERPGTY